MLWSRMLGIEEGGGVTRLRMAELRMVRMMCGKTLKDKCKTQELRARVGVDDIEGFLRVHRLQWAGHVERAGEGALRQVREMKVEGTRKRGRLRLMWEELVRKDMNTNLKFYTFVKVSLGLYLRKYDYNDFLFRFKYRCQSQI